MFCWFLAMIWLGFGWAIARLPSVAIWPGFGLVLTGVWPGVLPHLAWLWPSLGQLFCWVVADIWLGVWPGILPVLAKSFARFLTRFDQDLTRYWLCNIFRSRFEEILN